MNKPVRTIVAVAVCALLGVCVQPASAARRYNAIGMSVFPNYTVCVGWNPSGSSGAGITATGASTNPNCNTGFFKPLWLVPISLDTTGAKTVKLTVKLTQANQISCGLVEYNATGGVVQSVSYDAFPVGSFVTASKNITVTTGDSLSVMCSFDTANADIANARWLTVEF